MLFSQNIPPSPSPTDSKGLFCTSVSLSVLQNPLQYCKVISLQLIKINEKKKALSKKRKVPIFMDCLICTWNFTPLGASFGIAKMCVSSHSGSIEQEHRWTHSQNLVTVPSFPQVYVMIPASQESHYDALISS